MSAREEAEKLSEKVEALRKEMEKALKPYKEKIQDIEHEMKKISHPFYDKIINLEQSYLDQFLIDSNGHSIKEDDILINQRTGFYYKVVRRFQQELLYYLGNPRVVVVRLNKNGKTGTREISLFPSDLKEYSIKVIEEKNL